MKSRKKSVKNYIFFSNAIMVLVVLGIFLVVNALIFRVYESRENDTTLSDSEVTATSYKARELLETWDWAILSGGSSGLQNLSDELEELGFMLFVEMDDRLMFSSLENADVSDFNYLDSYFSSDGTAHVYVLDGITCILLETQDARVRIFAVDGEYNEFLVQLRQTAMWVSYYLVSVVLFVLILTVVSALCTRQTIRHIMKPLNILMDASSEMKKGNYTQPVTYEGDQEFEAMCSSFDEMRANINRAEEQQVAYEKARTDMIAGISHDLRTPLTAIRGTIKGLQDGIVSTPEMQQKFLDTAYRRTLEMDQLLEQLFYFSKIETGNMPMQKETLEWNAYLKGYIEKLRDCDTEGQCEYIFSNMVFKTVAGVSPESGIASGASVGAALNPGYEFASGEFQNSEEKLYSEIDRQQMERILENIVGNSKKYANAEHLVISIGLGCEDGRAVVTVSDNGQGVPEEKLPHIFDKFYRADESRNKTEGNGLGLHIVKYLAEAMDGTVEAVNCQGLQIRMTFPASLICDSGTPQA